MLIDTDSPPQIPFSKWTVAVHIQHGFLAPENLRIRLVCMSHQSSFTRGVTGHTVLNYLAERKVLNANVLDWYLSQPSQIPREWLNKYVFFWGTVYKAADKRRFVRSLNLRAEGARSMFACLNDTDWDSDYPAAVLVE